MADLIYSTIASVDGYVADEEGNFDWATPDDEVHRFANDLERAAGTHLYGRRMYETMVYWETALEQPGISPAEIEYAEIWRDTDKIVFSRTLEEPSSARTRIERALDAEAVRALKSSAERSVTIGGPELAAQALTAGLVDEVQLFVVPAIVGGGNPAFPDGLRLLDLGLEEERRFANGTAFLRYRT